jgi:hypothetical protein
MVCSLVEYWERRKDPSSFLKDGKNIDHLSVRELLKEDSGMYRLTSLYVPVRAPANARIATKSTEGQRDGKGDRMRSLYTVIILHMQ